MLPAVHTRGACTSLCSLSTDLRLADLIYFYLDLNNFAAGGRERLALLEVQKSSVWRREEHLAVVSASRSCRAPETLPPGACVIYILIVHWRRANVYFLQYRAMFFSIICCLIMKSNKKCVYALQARGCYCLCRPARCVRRSTHW
jgi:hypothetical protein